MALTYTITVRLDGRLRVVRSALKSGLEAESMTGAAGKMKTRWLKRYEGSTRRHFVANSTGSGGDWPPLAKETLLGRRTVHGGKTILVRQKVAMVREAQMRVMTSHQDLLKAQSHEHRLRRRAGGTGAKGASARARARQALPKANAGVVAALDRHQKARAKYSAIREGNAGASSLYRDTAHGGELGGFSGIRVGILRDTDTLFKALVVDAQGNVSSPIRNGVRYGFADVAHNADDVTIAQIAAWHQAGAGHLPQRRILVGPDQECRRGMVEDLRTFVVETIRAARKGPQQ